MTQDVLALRALGLGDALTAVPALRGTRRAWPESRLHLAGPAEIGLWLRALGVVDEVVAADGLVRLDWIGTGHVGVNLHGRGPRSHAVLAATHPARLVGYASDGFAGPQWRDDEHEVLRWCRLLRASGGQCGPDDLRLSVAARGRRGHVVLHPGASAPARRWPPERWVRVAAALAADGQRVILTGSRQERRLCGEICSAATGATGAPEDLSGGLGLDELAGLIAGAALLVCGDTGVAHLATALGTPSVLLFGPTSPRLWGPLIDRPRHVVLWHGAGLRPGDPNGRSIDPALASIGVREVLDAVGRLLSGPQVTRSA